MKLLYFYFAYVKTFSYEEKFIYHSMPRIDFNICDGNKRKCLFKIS